MIGLRILHRFLRIFLDENQNIWKVVGAACLSVSPSLFGPSVLRETGPKALDHLCGVTYFLCNLTKQKSQMKAGFR